MKSARGDRELLATDTVIVRWVGGEDAHVPGLPVESEGDGTIGGGGKPLDEQDGDVIVTLPVEGDLPVPLVVVTEVGTRVVVRDGAAIAVLGRA